MMRPNLTQTRISGNTGTLTGRHLDFLAFPGIPVSEGVA